jgi:hypothetical protein
MAVTVELVADVSDVVRGAANMAERFEDVADSLVDLARDADKSGDKVAASMKDAGKATAGIDDGLKDAGSAVERFEDKAKTAFKKLSDSSGKAGKDVAKDTKHGFDESGEAVETFKDEAKSNLSEVASSFSGDMDSAVDLIQGTLGGLVADLGPAGLVGGAVAALAIGLAKAAADGEAERINRIGEAASALAGDIEAVGGDIEKVDFDGRMREWGLAIQDTREWWELWQDKALTGAQKIEEQIKGTGLSFKDMFRGASGTADNARDALKQIDVVLQDLKDSQSEYDTGFGGTFKTGGPEVDKRIKALEELRKTTEENVTIQDEAKHVSELLAKADVATAETTDEVKEATDKANEALERKAQLMDEAAGAAMDSMSAELDYNDAMRTNTEDILKNGKATDTKSAAGIANNKTLLDSAQAALALESAQIREGASTADVTAKTQAARDAFIKQAEAAGYSAAEAKGLADRYGLIPKNVDTKVQAHNVQQTKDEIAGVGKPVDVPVRPYLDPGAKWSFAEDLRRATQPVTQSVSMRLIKELGSSTP